MNLSKDNQDIYTVDIETYSKHMKDNWTEPKDLLSSFIKFLLFILFLVVSYFFYNIVKADLSFSEVFNKQELLSTYALLDSNEKTIDIVKEDYVEILAKNMLIDLDESKISKVLAVSKRHDEDIAPKKEEKIPEKLIVLIPKVVQEKVSKNAEISDNDLFSREYLNRVSAEINSL